MPPARTVREVKAAFPKTITVPMQRAGKTGRLNDAAKWMQALPMPDPGKAAADMMAHMDNAAAVKRVLGADPFAKGAAAALAPKLERIRANAEEAMSRAQGAALLRGARIDGNADRIGAGHRTHRHHRARDACEHLRDGGEGDGLRGQRRTG